jgi:hypothetical protein
MVGSLWEAEALNASLAAEEAGREGVYISQSNYVSGKRSIVH